MQLKQYLEEYAQHKMPIFKKSKVSNQCPSMLKGQGRKEQPKSSRKKRYKDQINMSKIKRGKKKKKEKKWNLKLIL